MEEYLVCFETAKLAKEMGFNERVKNAFVTDFLKTKDENTASVIKEIGCAREHDINMGGNMYESVKIYSTYTNNKNQPQILIRPSQSLLQKWLREKHNIDVCVLPLPYHSVKKYYEVVVDKLTTTWSGYETYEDALEIGLLKALETLETI